MERPILFNSLMVQAILEGKKTCTRRIIKEKYENADITWFKNKYGKRLVYMQNDTKEIINKDGIKRCQVKACEEIKKPYEIGDILYVRETWWKGDILNANEEIEESGVILYAADGEIKEDLDYEAIKWRPSIHMPKKIARIFLEVIDVRAERLQDITEDEAIKEGIRAYTKDGEVFKYAVDESQYKWSEMPRKPIEPFKKLWDSCYNWPKCWDYNPWVWVIEFKRIERK